MFMTNIQDIMGSDCGCIFNKVVNPHRNWTMKMIFDLDNKYLTEIRMTSSSYNVSTIQLLDSLENQNQNQSRLTIV